MGHFFRQIWRKADVAIYERSLTKEKPAHELELIIINVAPYTLLPDGKTLLPVHEVYPSASKWGTVGWTFPVRYREWVLGLAEQLGSVLNERAAFVRDATHRKWQEEQKR